MGLDQYLSRRTYVKQWDHDIPEERYSVTVKKGGKLVKHINPSKISYIEEEVATWRKANQIHKWFVDNVQEGKDDCGTYEVEAKQLLTLLVLCKQVLAASKLTEGIVENGYTFKADPSDPTKSVREPILELGKTIDDPSVAEELLPSASGFFFGNTNYNEWYLEDIKYTIKVLESLNLDQEQPGYYQYSSSW